MEERIKALENKVEKHQSQIDLLKKDLETSIKALTNLSNSITNFIEDYNELTDKIEKNFITLEENDEITYKKVSEIIEIINDIRSGRI